MGVSHSANGESRRTKSGGGAEEEDGYRRHTAVLVRSAVLSPPCPVGDVGSQDRHRPLARSALSWIGRALEFSSFVGASAMSRRGKKATVGVIEFGTARGCRADRESRLETKPLSCSGHPAEALRSGASEPVRLTCPDKGVVGNGVHAAREIIEEANTAISGGRLQDCKQHVLCSDRRHQ